MLKYYGGHGEFVNGMFNSVSGFIGDLDQTSRILEKQIVETEIKSSYWEIGFLRGQISGRRAENASEQIRHGVDICNLSLQM